MHEQISYVKELYCKNIAPRLVFFIVCVLCPLYRTKCFLRKLSMCLNLSTKQIILPQLQNKIEWCSKCYNVTKWEMLERKLCSKSHTVQESAVLKLNRGHLYLFLQDEKCQDWWCKQRKKFHQSSVNNILTRSALKHSSSTNFWGWNRFTKSPWIQQCFKVTHILKWRRYTYCVVFEQSWDSSEL